MATREIFRQNLKYYRKKCCMTQEMLSEKIGLNPKYIADIESRSKFPSAETIDAIALALNIHVSQLFAESDFPAKTASLDTTAFISSLVDGISRKVSADVRDYLFENLPSPSEFESLSCT